MEKIIAMTPAHLCDPKIAIAATRAGELGILDLGDGENEEVIRSSLERLARFSGARGRWGIRWDTFGEASRSPGRLASFLSEPVEVLVLAGVETEAIQETLERGRPFAREIFLEVTLPSAALAAQAAGVDGVILKGHEAGGRVSRSGSFILLQQLYGKLKVPYWVQGGMGLHTAVAAHMAGATGVVLCEQFWLTDESPFSDEEREMLGRLDGGETVCIELEKDHFRCYSRFGPGKLREIEKKRLKNPEDYREINRILLKSESNSLIPLGQDIACARSLAEQFGTVGGICAAIHRSTAEHARLAKEYPELMANSSLAREHGTLYPIVQGPMARVSDIVPFCKAVGKTGGLPFLALSFMKSGEIRPLLQEAREQMGDMPWGVGILGFLPLQIRQDQLKVIQEIHPPFAIIAGGRPGQAQELEALGISTYLHVPSPSLLSMFIKEGARKFIFEGKECGGHVGPRTSFVLWESAVEILLNSNIDDPGQVRVLFAGGIHDGLSAAMVTAIAAPLAALGMKIGVVMGTAYLFTHEAVECCAITEEYQKQALACENTVLLESGAGHASRCIKTPFVDEFNAKKFELLCGGEPEEQIRVKLEMLNLGRLRTAAKGIVRNPQARDPGGRDKFISLDTENQRREGMYMIGQVAEIRHCAVSMADLHSGVSEGSGKYLEVLDASCSSNEVARDCSKAIAIVGMAGMFPDASDLRQYWQNIMNRVNSIREVEEDRWRVHDFYSTDRFDSDKTYSKWGGFLKDIAFNPLKYGIPPVSLKSIEPIQLLALEVARQALEDAGYHRRDFPRSRTATIFGVGGAHDLAIAYTFRTMMRHYLARMDNLAPEILNGTMDALYERLPKLTEDSFPGILDNVVAGRIANRLDLGGTNFTADAACGSSFAALDAGIRQLQTRACDVALVGAADGTNNALGYLCFSSSQAFSPRGKCCAFDNSADGMVVGEGVAAVVLKRLDDAERDGDHIYAVIKGIGTSSDGRNRSLTAPHPEGQVLALQRAYEDAGVCPSTVELVEAHGTGTVIGDKTEIQALTKVYNQCGTVLQHCAVGSVKSMIGHTKVAAGMASMIKCALSLKHRVLPPTLGVKVPNAAVDFSRSPFYISMEARPWLKNNGGQPRRCGVSAFGFGGTNFHVVLEEYDRDERERAKLNLLPREAEIISLSGATRSEVEASLRHLSLALEKTPGIQLEQLAYSVFLKERKRRRQGAETACRLSIVAKSTEDLSKKLEWASGKIPSGGAIENSGVYYSESDPVNGEVCFLFPGQGAQRVNMFKDLVLLMPSTHPFFEEGNEILKDCYEQPLSRYIYPLPVFSDEERKRQQEEINDTHIAQPALAVVDLAAVEILRSFGLQADFMAGHSYGEYVALCAAGSISREDLLRLSEVRGKTVKNACAHDPGTMAAVQADAEKTSAALKKLGLNVFPANCNAPDQTIIGGPVRHVDEAVKALNGMGLFTKKIPVCAAFHTPFMEEVCECLSPEFSKISFKTPQVKVFSNTTGKPYPESPQEIRELLLRHLCLPVHFDRQIRNMYEAGARIFIEAGPARILTGLVGRILGDMPHTALPMDVSGRSGCLQLAHLLAHTTALGLPVDLEPWFAGRRLAKIDTDEAFKRAEAEATPSPVTWRIRTNRVQPWYETASTAPANKGSAAISKQVAPHGIESAVRTTVPEGAKTPQKNQENQERRNAMNMKEFSNDPTPVAKEEKPSVNPSDAASVLPLFQSSMKQFFELQLEQQKVTHRFLDFQERMLQAVLGGSPVHVPVEGQASHSFQAPSQGPAIVMQSVPPAPVLPKWVAQPSSPPSADTLSDLKATAGRTQSPEPSAPLEPTRMEHPLPETKAVSSDSKAEKRIPDKAEFLENLLNIVSERTGYPREMLDLDLHMEADLGIDSIKKVEIFAGMNDRYEVMRAMDQETLLEQLAGLTTLRSIADWYDKSRSRMLGSEPPPVPKPIAEEPEVPKRLDAQPSTAPQAMAVPAVEDPPQPAMPLQSVTDIESLKIDPVKRFAIQPAPISLNVAFEPVRFPSEQAVLCLVKDTGPLNLLASVFPEDLYRVIRIMPGKKTKMLKENCYEVDFSSLASVRELPSLIARSGERVGALFNLMGLKGVSKDADGLDMGDLDGAKKWFLLLKVFGDDLKVGAGSSGGWLVNLTAMGGQFGLKNERPFSIGPAGSIGLTKTIAREWSNLKVKSIDLDPTAPEDILKEKIRQELSVFDDLVEVGLDEKGRWRIDVVETAGDFKVRSLVQLGSESVILVTGGAHGITAEILKVFAAKYRPQIVIVGRSVLEEESLGTRDLATHGALREFLIKKLRQEDASVTPAAIERQVQKILRNRRIRENLEAMKKAGARVEYHSLDVRDGVLFGKFIDGIYERLGRIDGVIHGAGINEDKLVRDKALDSFSRVFDTKVVPARVLCEKLRPDGLKFMVFFSSVAGRFGSAGQSDYSAANEILNKVAVRLNRIWPAHVVSINWGPWELGMVNDELRRYFAEKGVNLIPLQEGVKMFFEELHHSGEGVPEVLISRSLENLK